MQSASSYGNHHYNGLLHAIKSIYTQEGIKGLYRGTGLSMGRSMLGSGVNLSVFSWIKQVGQEVGYRDGVFLDLVSGLASGFMAW